MAYDIQSVYDPYLPIVPDDCGCVIPGLVTLKDCDGNTKALLTPNDAEIYVVGTTEVPVGYVKVFHPVTNVFLGVLTIDEAQTYITFLTP